MKTKIKTIAQAALVIVALLTSYNASAYEGDSIVIHNHAGIKRVKIDVLNIDTPFSLTIREKNGVILHKERVKSSAQFSKIFNMSELADGEYILEIKSVKGKQTRTFFVEGANVLTKDSADSKNTASFVVNKNTMLLSYINGSKDYSYLQLLNANGDVVFEDHLNNLLVIQRQYNLSKLTKGSYTAKLYSGNQSYVSEFCVK